MLTTIKARFFNGVFEPLSEVDLPEGKEVDVIFEDSNKEALSLSEWAMV
ncbi:MAG: antitoxin family protein [Nitrospirae bacterium]|nr:antitoxin family protein [Nitrospirota bacterium]